MKLITPSFYLFIFISLFFVGCSKSPLQTRRLDSAQEYIISAEQALSQPTTKESIRKANDDIGVATAYLATLKDFAKYQTESDKKRFKALKIRANIVKKRLKK